MFKELGWKMVEGASKIMPILGAILALAAFVLIATCTFVGAVAISDNYWDFSWN